MKLTRENAILLFVSAFIGAFGAALLSAGVGLNFATFATIGIIVVYVLVHGPKDTDRYNFIFGLIGIVIGVIIQLATPAKAPVDNQLLLAGLALLLIFKP